MCTISKQEWYDIKDYVILFWKMHMTTNIFSLGKAPTTKHRNLFLKKENRSQSIAATHDWMQTRCAQAFENERDHLLTTNSVGQEFQTENQP